MGPVRLRRPVPGKTGGAAVAMGPPCAQKGVVTMARKNSLPVIEEAVALDGSRVVRLTHRGGHFYLVDGRVLPSPTTVLRATLPKEAASWAYAARERERAVRAACMVYARGGGLSPEQFEAAVWSEIKSSEPPSATALGLEVHSWIAGGLRRMLYQEQVELPGLSEQAGRVVDAVRAWWRESVVRPLHAERVVVGDGWAGTMDFIAELRGELGTALVDLKVTRAQEPVTEWLCQVSAYAHAQRGLRVSPVVLGVDPDSLDVRLWPVSDPGRWYRVFVAALNLYRELRAEELAEVEAMVSSMASSLSALSALSA